MHPSQDNEHWNQWVAGKGTGHLLQSSHWGDFKSRHGWDAVRVALRSGNEIRAGAQVLFRRAFGISVGYIPKGPILDDLDEDSCLELMEAVGLEARARRAVFLLAEPNLALPVDAGKILRPAGFVPGANPIQPISTIKLDLRKSDEVLLTEMKPKTRYNIRLAAKRGVVVREAASLGDVAVFGRLNEETSRRDNFGVHPPSYYSDAWQTFCPAGLGTMLIAEHENEPVAAIMVFRFGTEAIYMYGASSNRKREHMPNYLLQWEGIQWAKRNGCRTYDLWGIPPEVTPETQLDEEMLNRRDGLWGVYRFKSGFGGTVVNYPMAFQLTYNKPLYWLFKKFRKDV